MSDVCMCAANCYFQTQSADSPLMSVFLGPFLTRREAAKRCGVSSVELVARRDVLRLGGRYLEEVYFAFQFDADGLRPAIGELVDEMASAWDQLTIAHWLMRPNGKLDGQTPLTWLNAGRDKARVIGAARSLADQPAAPGRKPGSAVEDVA